RQLVLERMGAIERQAGLADTLQVLLGQRPQPYVEDRIAFIPIDGILAQGVAPIEKACGVTDMEDVVAWVDEAVVSAEVDAIFFRVNSPGGSVTGMPELAAQIADIRNVKPSMWHTKSICASGGVYVTAGCLLGYATASAEVGSVGAYTYVLDDSEAFRMMGLKAEVIANDGAVLKGRGAPGVPLSRAQLDDIQASVNHAGKRFQDFVRSNRKSIDESVFKAGMFDGDQAVEVGLIDHVASESQAIADLKKMIA
ncbi:MAG: S49 family peptidase, partial [Verrucomicrobiae bacterium]|nr:S49 family peptidase [Verrucomicrobiae bacterium]